MDTTNTLHNAPGLERLSIAFIDFGKSLVILQQQITRTREGPLKEQAIREYNQLIQSIYKPFER